MTRRLVPAALAAALLAAPGSSVWAGPPTEQLRDRIDRVVKVLEEPALKKDAKTTDRRATLRTIANEIFDFAEISQRSLGRHWQARTPLHSPQFVFRLARSGDIFRMNRPLLELLTEIQQHLCQLAGRIQPVCPRSVVPLLVPCQLDLQTQILNVQIVSTLLLAVTLGKQRTQHRFQRCAVLR